MKIKKILSSLVAGALAITTLASVSSFSSFAATDVETPLIPALNCKVKYQTKLSPTGGTDIRFVAEVKVEDVLYADSAEWYIEAATADAPDDFVEVETQPLSKKAYKSLIANGKKVTAPEGYCYVISQSVGSFNEGDQVYGEIFLLNFGNACNRVATIGGSTPTPDSSSESEPESVPVPDDSSSQVESDAMVIWEGSQDINKWQSYKIDGVEGIPNAEKGGVLTVYATPTDPAKKAQVQLATTQGEKDEWTTLVDKADNDTFDVIGEKVQMVLSEENAALLRTARSLHLNGSNVTVTKYVYNAPGTINASGVIWEGSVDITAWTQDAPLGVANIPLATAGGKIIIEATANGATPQIQLSGNDIEWTWFDIKDPSTNEAYDLTGDSITIVLTEETADLVANAKKLFVKGIDVTVTKVTYVAPGGSKPDSSSESEAESAPDDSSSQVESDAMVIWEGSQDINKWQSYKIDGVEGVPTAEKGGVLTVYATPTDPAKKAQVQLATTQGEKDEWTTLVDKADNDAFDVIGGKVQMVLSEENAALLRTARSLHLNGSNVTVTKYVYNAPGTIDASGVIWEGSEDITAWTQDVSLGVANIPLATAGGKIIIEATANGATPQIQLSGNDIEWTWFDIKDPSTNEAYDLTGESITIVLTEETADLVANAKKLFVKGIDVTVTKVSYSA